MEIKSVGALHKRSRVSNLYELCSCPNLARQNRRVLTPLPHSLSDTAAAPLPGSCREMGNPGINAVPFDLGILKPSLDEYLKVPQCRLEVPDGTVGAAYHAAY
jgi:hypothetical protein